MAVIKPVEVQQRLCYFALVRINILMFSQYCKLATQEGKKLPPEEIDMTSLSSTFDSLHCSAQVIAIVYHTHSLQTLSVINLLKFEQYGYSTVAWHNSDSFDNETSQDLISDTNPYLPTFWSIANRHCPRFEMTSNPYLPGIIWTWTPFINLFRPPFSRSLHFLPPLLPSEWLSIN